MISFLKRLDMNEFIYFIIFIKLHKWLPSYYICMISKYSKYFCKNKEEIYLLNNHYPIPLNWYDVSTMIDMSEMFMYNFEFNEYISNWKVANTLNMDRMFCNCISFQQSLSLWKLNKHCTTYDIFYNTHKLSLLYQNHILSQVCIHDKNKLL